NRRRLDSAVAAISRLPLDSDQTHAIEEIVREEKQIFAVLSNGSATELAQAEAVSRFPALADHAQIITARSAAPIDPQAEPRRARRPSSTARSKRCAPRPTRHGGSRPGSCWRCSPWWCSS